MALFDWNLMENKKRNIFNYNQFDLKHALVFVSQKIQTETKKNQNGVLIY
jgi:hypothetical protein